jgi:hypothetical protein
MTRFNGLRARKGILDLNAAVTVAALPAAPTLGMVRVVSDATTPAAGSAPVGGGAAKALVWYNGAAWRVVGV